MKPKFSEAAQKEYETLLTRYPDKRAPLLMVLHLAQREFGWLSRPVLEYVGELLGLPYSEVYDTASFYTMYKLAPTGKYHLQVCHTLSCALRGAGDLCDHVEKNFGIGNKETSGDGKFTLLKVECLGACGTAPVVQINDDYHENLTVESFDKLLKNLE